MAKQTTAGRSRGKTSVPISLAFLVGLAVMAVIYLGAYSLKDYPAIPVYTYLFERGWFQYISTLAFGVAVGILLLKTDKIKAEKAAFDVIDKQVFGSFVGKTAIPVEQGVAVKQALENLDPKIAQTMLANRLENTSRRLANTRSAAEVDNIFQILSDGDANAVASSYTTVRFLIALIPLLGFLGNVYGVGQGIGEFSKVLSTAQSFEAVRPALQFAAFQLAIAFDATFLALFYSGILLFLHALVEQREEGLLARIDEYCLDKFVSRIHVVSSDTAEMRDAMTALTSDALDSIGGGLKAVVKAIDRLPANESPGRTFDAKASESLTEIKETALSIANILEEEIVGIKKKVDDLGSVKQAGGGNVPADMSHTLVELQQTLNALRPAIDSMSADMAKEVDKVLGQLLRVMVVVNRGDRWNKEELRVLNDVDLLKRLFEPQG